MQLGITIICLHRKHSARDVITTHKHLLPLRFLSVMLGDTRAAKLRRLDRFRRSIPDVSQSALDAILRHARTCLPDLLGRKAMRQGRDLQVNEVTPYGPVKVSLEVELLDGSKDTITVVNAFAQLWIASKRCEGFGKLLSECLAATPPSHDRPWKFILYSDEVVPGNVIGFHNRRKGWVMYYSFLELGVAVLSNEDAWFCIASARSDRVKQISGAMAQVFKVILKYIFAVGGHSFQYAGINLTTFQGVSVRLWARLEIILQDGGAHKQVFLLKGDAGHKFCMGCRNLYSACSGITGDDGEDLLTSNLHLFSEMDFATDADIRGTVKRLAFVADHSADQLPLRQIACGFNHDKHSLLLDDSLNDIVRPAKNLAHDWMHCFVVHGVWNTLVFLLLVEITKVDPDVVSQLREYIKCWSLPARLSGIGSSLHDAFTSVPWKSSCKSRSFKCTASEGICLYAIIACFISAIYLRANVCKAECTAYLKACDVLDLLIASAHGVVTSQQLHDAVDSFLKSCLAAGWRQFMHPKFHWCLHLSIELREFGVLLTCWVHERKHRMVKRYTKHQQNTRSYEDSILAEITCQHFYNLDLVSTFDLSVGMLNPLACTARMKQLVGCIGIPLHLVGNTSRVARISKFECVSVGDVVVFKNTRHLNIGKIILFAVLDGVQTAVVSHWRHSFSNLAQGSIDVHCPDVTDIHFCLLEDICAPCSYRHKPGGLVQVIVSCMHRSRVA